MRSMCGEGAVINPSSKECICLCEEHRSGIHKEKRRDYYKKSHRLLLFAWGLLVQFSTWRKVVLAYLGFDELTIKCGLGQSLVLVTYNYLT